MLLKNGCGVSDSGFAELLSSERALKAEATGMRMRRICGAKDQFVRSVEQLRIALIMNMRGIGLPKRHYQLRVVISRPELGNCDGERSGETRGEDDDALANSTFNIAYARVSAVYTRCCSS